MCLGGAKVSTPFEQTSPEFLYLHFQTESMSAQVAPVYEILYGEAAGQITEDDDMPGIVRCLAKGVPCHHIHHNLLENDWSKYGNSSAQISSRLLLPVQEIEQRFAATCVEIVGCRIKPATNLLSGAWKVISWPDEGWDCVVCLECSQLISTRREWRLALAWA